MSQLLDLQKANSLLILQAHCQSLTSPRFNQSFVKELAKPTHRAKLLKKYPTLKKIKNAETRADTYKKVK